MFHTIRNFLYPLSKIIYSVSLKIFFRYLPLFHKSNIYLIKVIRNYFLILSAILLTSCSTVMYYQINSKNNSNFSNTTMVDLIFTFDKEADENIKKISAKNWFSEKEKYMNDFGINNKFKIISHEVVPGTFILLTKVIFDKEPLDLIIFINYYSEGEHRIILTSIDELKMILQLGYDKHNVITNYPEKPDLDNSGEKNPDFSTLDKYKADPKDVEKIYNN
jgi:hypothetical protein